MSVAPHLPRRRLSYPVCILAGGLGTRLGSLVKDVPKPLLEVAGRPFVMHQLDLLRDHGIDEVVLCVGFKGEQIEKAVGHDHGGMKVSYSYDTPDLDGTLGAIRRALPLLGERFLYLYGDTYLQVDYAQAAAEWRASELPAFMAVLRNEGRWQTSNARLADGLVVEYDKRHPESDMHWIDYGFGGLTVEALRVVDESVSDLADLQHELARRALLLGFEATERFRDIGTPRALAETDAFFRSRQGTAQ